MITIVDYEAGNLKSICNMLDFLNIKYKVSFDPKEIEEAKKIIFPGQGHFAQAMKNLKEKNLIEPIKNAISNDAKFLGICLGLQVLFEKSAEANGVKGLGIFKGEVKKFTKGKIPQIGWNKIITTPQNTYLSDDYFYFVNSYYVCPQDQTIISSTCDYNINFAASVEYKNVTAVQFHPEKSSKAGVIFFKKWLNS
ncbi:MAG TPA: imidazole glycerol phosphate synthase subunit HisH [Candidatus Gastranaerophilaceae bacterium]|nr:imidazole glycerol phosphate synthase subunit HisH [Candidatus Gastranaerophilaceae bacterium]HPT40907.1 imidazole glycerol phosphate synthase subunit HisH [Candidatus Gastranaerophilaceae bacterium]